MRTFRTISTSVAVAFAAFAIAASNASAQSIPAAEGQAFMGAWALSIEGTPLEINISAADGQVAADVTVMGTTTKATTITKVGEALSLRYVADMGGQQAPITIRLTPDGQNLATVIDVADGAFNASGTATKKAS